ncbi:hypothetical protein P170DRAFT_457972 [Aspergillus steynii IBT 23096]|uniref:Serine/threonine-protein kinase ppk6 n=1 Tax=Aspergillus steynii IBT 23096 TaxID=1392250 RepID=A0A2I2FYH0_9EURO|nr:uncharacterized protein P170DRAFT_457972 [Aspergillus steynii IBT 23096]PLB45680.1 hypothetical protein P170DRAFT_457972 [Aspergillus steynii IBT 23096]
MSADLFAEFGAGASAGQNPGNQASRPQTNSLIPDLESFSDAAFPNASQHVNGPMPHVAQARTLPKQQSSFYQSNFPQLPQYESNSDVLFDATQETASNDDSEDWGEFESADKSSPSLPPNEPVPRPAAGVKPTNHSSERAKTHTTAQPKQLDLLDSLTLDDNPPASRNQPTAATGLNKAKAQTKKVVSTKPPTPAEEEPFEEWGDFIDGPSTESPTKTAPRVDTTRPVGNSNFSVNTRRVSSHSSGVSNQPVNPSAVRPTNIPPPSVLLELFPRLFEQLRQDATHARRNLQQKESVEDAASSILCVLKAVARVVSGRTLRWKRDSILSQSMKIGPARSGKSGGMKLNTVNKNEDIKEKQEAVDVIVLWRDRAALFNSVIQASGRRPIQAVPENIRVTTATAEQGAIKASHACALCGLKRDERLPKVDEAVEDSFGEWWTDHWGHTDCRQFWETHKDMLFQR